MKTPYAIHPIWSAVTLLSEPKLPPEIRHMGYKVMAWHDLFEDTVFTTLPAGTEDEVQQLVREMTFAGLSEEMELVWERSDLTKLFKLYDKVSTLLDGVWMTDAKWNGFVQYTLRLVDFVEQTYGPNLNIIKIARHVAILRPE